MNFRQIGLSILKLFFRVNYLNRAIFVIVVAILGELAAIGSRDGLIELATQLKTQLGFEGWKYWGVLVLEAIFIGGSWIILTFLFVLLIGISILKYKTRRVSSFKPHFNSQLREYEKLVLDFKSVTALKLLKKLIADVDDSSIEGEERILLNAKAYYLMGLAKIDEEDKKFSANCLIQSYQLDPKEVIYKERACTSYYNTDQKEKALELANEIFIKDKLNERANVIKLFTDPTSSIEAIPSSVKEGLTFKRLYFNYLMHLGDEGELKVKKLAEIEVLKNSLPIKVEYANIDYWEQLGRYAFYFGMKEQPNKHAIKESYADNKFIVYSNSVLATVYQTIQNTEAFENSKAYKLTAFYFFQTEYLLNGSIEPVKEMVRLYETTFTNAEYSDQLVIAVLVCLNQVKLYGEALSISSTIKGDEDFKHIIEFQALTGLKRNEEAIASFLKYLKGVTVIGDLELHNLLNIGDFLLQRKLDISEFYSKNIEVLSFETEIKKKITFCYFYRYSQEKLSEVEREVNAILDTYEDLGFELKSAVLIILNSIKQRSKAIQFIEKFHNWQTEPLALEIYTECLLNEKKDSEKLLGVLKFRRTNQPREYLMGEEINIYLLAENSQEILNVSNLGISLFPNNVNFVFFKILSLYKLKSESTLLELLNDDLLSKDFNVNQKFALSKICVEKKKTLLGLELYYRETIKTNSPALKQSYFALTTFIEDRSEMESPIEISIGVWVRILAGDETIHINVDETTLRDHWIVKHLGGMKTGESKHLQEPLTYKKIQVTVLRIFDKYSGLAAQILDEIAKSDFTGMTIKSIKFDDSSPEGISKALIAAFGEAGDKEKIKRDEALNKYYTGELSFTELVGSISRDKILEVYSFLTSNQSDGFIVIPIRDFNNIPIPKDREFVIDLTSLPILMKISELNPGCLKHKFIISQFIIELLENELLEAKSMPEESGRVSVTSFGVTTSLTPPGYKEYRVKTLNQMLEWITVNCETRHSKDKLDMILQHPKMFMDGNFIFNSFIDTAFISHGRTLISDDRFHNKHFRNQYLTISLEYYLYCLYSERYSKDFAPILIQNHYVGIRLNCENIKNEFKKPFYGGVNTFHYCLKNLSFSINHDILVFNEALDFVKYIYTEQMPLKMKKDTSQKVLVHALKDYPNLHHLKKTLIAEVRTRFYLLPLDLPEVLDDFIVAFDILYESKR